MRRPTATYALDACARSSAEASLTTAQLNAKTQHCAKCPTSATSGCLDFFQPAQADGGAAGIGYIVLLSNDDIATSIATTCGRA